MPSVDMSVDVCRPRNDDDRNVRIDVVDHAAAEIRGEPANDHTIQ